MTHIPIENLLKGKDKSTYKTVILAFKRALELGAGSAKLVEADPKAKLTSIAIKEIEEEKVSYKLKKK